MTQDDLDPGEADSMTLFARIGLLRENVPVSAIVGRLVNINSGTSWDQIVSN